MSSKLLIAMVGFVAVIILMMTNKPTIAPKQATTPSTNKSKTQTVAAPQKTLKTLQKEQIAAVKQAWNFFAVKENFHPSEFPFNNGIYRESKDATGKMKHYVVWEHRTGKCQLLVYLDQQTYAGQTAKSVCRN